MKTEIKREYLAMASDAMIDLQAAARGGWKNPVSPSDPLKGGQYVGKAKKPTFPLGGNGRSILNPKNATLEEHDKRFHGGRYDGKGKCQFRDAMANGDKGDDLKSAEAVEANGGIGWEGNLDDKSSRELDGIVREFCKKHGEAIYDAVGEGGKYYRGERGNPDDPGSDTVREYDVRDLIDDDLVAEEVVDALPGESKDLDAKKVVAEVARRLKKYLDELPKGDLGDGRVAK